MTCKAGRIRHLRRPSLLRKPRRLGTYFISSELMLTILQFFHFELFVGHQLTFSVFGFTGFENVCIFSECHKGGFCNFMHLKPISRDLRRRLYGRHRRDRLYSRFFAFGLFKIESSVIVHAVCLKISAVKIILDPAVPATVSEGVVEHWLSRIVGCVVIALSVLSVDRLLSKLQTGELSRCGAIDVELMRVFGLPSLVVMPVLELDNFSHFCFRYLGTSYVQSGRCHAVSKWTQFRRFL